MGAKMLQSHFIELIRLTACDLAPDVQRALEGAVASEEGRERSTLELMLKNAQEARAKSIPICQDTGSLLFYIEHGSEMKPVFLEKVILQSVARATQLSYLRPNAVDPILGKNSGDNTGGGSPYLHFRELEQPGKLLVRLMLKGGGSENCGVQYTLPDQELGVGRDLSGIRRCILNAALKAQGFGCAPGVLGVCVGGDRMTSYQESKEQFFRALDDENPDPVLRNLEMEMHQKVNQLGIGPMGFGGKTTVLGVKIGVRHRHPASFFVSVSYTCWAYRRRRMEYGDGQVRFL